MIFFGFISFLFLSGHFIKQSDDKSPKSSLAGSFINLFEIEDTLHLTDDNGNKSFILLMKDSITEQKTIKGRWEYTNNTKHWLEYPTVGEDEHPKIVKRKGTLKLFPSGASYVWTCTVEFRDSFWFDSTIKQKKITTTIRIAEILQYGLKMTSYKEEAGTMQLKKKNGEIIPSMPSKTKPKPAILEIDYKSFQGEKMNSQGKPFRFEKSFEHAVTPVRNE